MTTLEIGSTLDVTAERLAFGGYAIARHDSLVLFVPFAAPGDRVRVEITELDKRHAKARLVEVLAAGPHRREARCAHFGVCGGCQFQHVDYAEQLRQKAVFVRDAMVRTGGFEDWPEVEIHGAGEWGYRARTQLKIDRRRMGFHRAFSKTVVEIEQCPVLAPELEQALPLLRAALDQVPHNVRVHQIEGACGRDGAAFSPDLPGVRKDLVEHEVLGFRFLVEPDGFFQGNRLLVDRLVQHAVEGERGALAFDLYAGVGLFTLPLARGFTRVVGVEDERRAATLGRVNTKQNGMDHVHWFRLTTEEFLRQNRERPDVVLIDPPRLGARRALPQLLALAAPRMVYVSCDPNTMARDLRDLVAGGYAVESVHAFDMFPQTYHVECVAKLRWTRDAEPAPGGTS
ncbi:MAG: class I SAM-dependent RNA methyltransferase [Planctomycetota bacterium]